MSFLAIRSKWKAKSKAVSRRLASAPAPGNAREQPPPSAVSTESFESPFVVEIGSPNPDKSPQVDLDLNTDPLFPSGIFARPGSVSSGSQKHLYNPWTVRPRNEVEETVVVAGEDGSEQDDPNAWVDEPEPERASSSWTKKAAPTPLVIPGGQSRRASRRGGQRSAHDDDASVISGITLPGALIGNSFSMGGAEQSARMDGRLSGRITRIDSATLPRGDHPLLHQPVTRRSSLPEFEPDEDAPPVPPLPQSAARPDSGIYSSSSNKGSRRGSRQLLPPETPPIANTHRASQRLQPAEGHAMHRVSRISEASTPSAISPAVSTASPDIREASDRDVALANSLDRLSRKRSASSVSKPMYEQSLRQRSSRSVQSLLLHPDKFHSKPSTSSLPSTADEPEFSVGLPSAAIIGRTDSLGRLPAFPESAYLPETAGQPTTQLPGVSPDSPEPSAPPFTPDLLDGILSSAVPSTALQTPGLRYPETPSDLAPTSSSPGVSRASSVTRGSTRPSRRGSTRKSKILPRPVSAKPSAASVRDSIARRRRSRARSQSRGPGPSPRALAPPVSYMPTQATPLPSPRGRSELLSATHARSASNESKASSRRGRTPPPRLIPSVPPAPMNAPPPPPPPRSIARPGGSRGGSRQASRSRQPSPQPPPREPVPPMPCGSGTNVAAGDMPESHLSAEKTPTGATTMNGQASPVPPTPPAKDVLFNASGPTPPRMAQSSRPASQGSSCNANQPTTAGSDASIRSEMSAVASTPPTSSEALSVPTPPRAVTPTHLEAQFPTPRRPSIDSIAQRSPPPSYEQAQTPHQRGPRPPPHEGSPTPARRLLPQDEPLPSTPPHMRSRFDTSPSPGRAHGARPSIDATPPRSGTPPVTLQAAPSSYRRSTQTRPPGPVGPRPSGPRSRNASVSTGPRPQGHLLSASTSSVSTISASVSTSTSATSLPTASTSRPSTAAAARRPSNATADTRGGPRFQPEPVPIRPYTLEAAQWTFSSQELQGLVTRAIKQSAEPGSVRVLPLDVLEEQLPAELARLEARQTDLKTRYRLLVRKRNALFTAAGTGSGDTQAKLEDLRALTTTLDEISDAIYVARDQAAQLQVLAANHAGSALAIALRKINAAFLKRTRDAQDLAARCAVLEAERDDAWAAAQAVAADLDQLNETLAEGSIASIPESAGGRERVAMSRKTSTRATRSGFRSRRTSHGGPSSKRGSMAAPSPSISSQRFSMQSRSSVYSQQGPFSPDTSPPPVPKIPRLSMQALSAHGMSTPGGYSNASDRTPASSAAGAENTQALHDVMHMLGIQNSELQSQPRRRASMSVAPTPATPAFSFNVVGSPTLSPVPTTPASALMLHRSRSVSAMDSLGPSEHEAERVAVLAALDTGLITT